MNAKSPYKIREWHSAIREWDAFVTGPEQMQSQKRDRTVSKELRHPTGTSTKNALVPKNHWYKEMVGTKVWLAQKFGWH
jgi:hypothetical protein